MQNAGRPVLVSAGRTERESGLGPDILEVVRSERTMAFAIELTRCNTQGD